MAHRLTREMERLLADRRRDRTMATAARVAVGAMGLFAGVLVVRSLPALVRYVKMERM